MEQTIDHLIAAIKKQKAGEGSTITSDQFERFFGVSMFDNILAQQAAENFASKYGIKVQPHKSKKVVVFYTPDNENK